ncbi:MAG: hydrogenase expression/formation protein HypE [Deltaproteobacteria bacterium]|nr:hydrogenase expression/formation protein HypE [Deltaproteobacteria bacterium]
MKHDKIQLAHGGGGRLSHELIEKVFLPIIGNPILNVLNDQGIFEVNGSKFAFTTDSYVITPIFFPGGDIGDLAVYGTVNDLAMGGAMPLYLSLGLIIEEGFPMDDLKRILVSVNRAAETAGVKIITGDTKVVNKGSVDGIFVNTAGVGIVKNSLNVSGMNLEAGDKVLVSGYIGDHGIAIMSVREGLIFKKPVQSDTAPLHKLVDDILETNAEVHAMRDPTRGGVASTLNEFAEKSGVGILIEEETLPVRDEVREACEILGLDPLYVANEGKMIAVVRGSDAGSVLDAMLKNPHGTNARIIGEVTDSHKGKVILKTKLGTARVVDMFTGEQLPRIC